VPKYCLCSPGLSLTVTLYPSQFEKDKELTVKQMDLLKEEVSVPPAVAAEVGVESVIRDSK
jgi:hypothetical protein